MQITLGNIATVILKDSQYFEMQGEVVEIEQDGNPDGPIGLKFNEFNDPLGAFENERKAVRFERTELRVDKDWKSIEMRAFLCFGRGAGFTISPLPYLFDTGRGCVCRSFVHRRCLILLAFTGTIMEVDLCRACEVKYHGKCLEEWPPDQFVSEPTSEPAPVPAHPHVSAPVPASA